MSIPYVVSAPFILTVLDTRSCRSGMIMIMAERASPFTANDKAVPMFNLSKKDTVPTVMPKKAGSVARLSQEMEDVINQCSPLVAPELRKRVGYLHLYSDTGLLTRINSLNKKFMPDSCVPAAR